VKKGAARVFITDGSPADMVISQSGRVFSAQWPAGKPGSCDQFRGTMADSISGVDRQAFGGLRPKAATSGVTARPLGAH
jgi:hypothetical protein